MTLLKSNLGSLLRLWARLYVDSRTNASLKKKRLKGRNVNGRMPQERKEMDQLIKQNSSLLVMLRFRNSKRPNQLVEGGSWFFQLLK
jgi:hypothetical protein